MQAVDFRAGQNFGDAQAAFLIRDSVACTIAMNAPHNKSSGIVASLPETSREMPVLDKRKRPFVGLRLDLSFLFKG